MTVEVSKRTFSVEEYYHMLKAGILKEDDRVELIKGEIITMSPIGSRHAGCVNRLTGLLNTKLQQKAIVSVQNPVYLDKYSEPAPDLAILKPRSDYYSESHPQPADVLLIIEVADTTLTYDRDVKLPLYAKAGIAEVWIVNLSENIIEIYTTPQTGLFRKVEFFTAGDQITSSIFPMLDIKADQILA